MKRAVILAVVALAAATAAAPAGATSECKGLQVCVPVVGPWVVAPKTGVEFQLDCPPRFVIGGLDAELSVPAIDIGFVGGLGSPVNPGITTTSSAVFLGRFVGRGGGASFRPHIGCIPASGGGQRAPTAYQVFRPGRPTVRVVRELNVSLGTRHLTTSCGPGRRLIRATTAIGFFTFTPPAAAVIADLRVRQVVHGQRVLVTAHAGPAFRSLPAVPAIVQVDLVCVVGT
ncbi:MAG TPA: hypothetical protein VNY33_00915 [Gaiellaceae bacterium]|nr:hypothetical protein [Gaiellaceae bacterium]